MQRGAMSQAYDGHIWADYDAMVCGRITMASRCADRRRAYADKGTEQ